MDKWFDLTVTRSYPNQGPAVNGRVRGDAMTSLGIPADLFDLSGRVAVVTGAGSGLGQHMAAGLALYGADVVAADINDDGLATTVTHVTQTGRRGLAVHCDVTEPSDVDNLFEQTTATFSRVDILVNDAFATTRARPEELKLEDWKRALDVNATGYFLCAQGAGRRMIEGGRGGSIINVSSIGGSSGVGRGNFAYSVNKGAINQMTRELAIEWAVHKIRVNAIQPCQFRTPALEALIDDPNFDSDSLIAQWLKSIPLQRLGEPARDIVGPAVFLASDASAMVTGVCLPVDGGNLAFNAGGSLTW